jgi:hypothetical protein
LWRTRVSGLAGTSQPVIEGRDRPCHQPAGAFFAGTLLGILAFRNISEAGFRRTILVVLLFSGASLAFA